MSAAPRTSLTQSLMRAVVAQILSRRGIEVDQVLEVCPEALVLRYGLDFEAVRAPRGNEKLPSMARQCFKNAAESALAMTQTTYVEGFASPFEFPFVTHHAWITRCHDAIDSTWSQTGTSYRGIPFDTELLRESVLTTECYGAMLSHHRKRFKPYTRFDAALSAIDPQWRNAVRESEKQWTDVRQQILHLVHQPSAEIRQTMQSPGVLA